MKNKKADKSPSYGDLNALLYKAKQDGLFLRGDQRRIADMVGLDESSISRVLSGEYFNLRIVQASLEVAEMNRRELVNSKSILKSGENE